MWPSEPLASRIYDWANWGLIAGLVIGVTSTILVVWMGNVKEAYLRKQVADVNHSTEQLKRENISLLKQLTEQGPRSHLLYGQRRSQLIERLKPFAGQRVEVRTCNISFNLYVLDNDTIGVAMLLRHILGEAGWAVNPPAVESCSGTGIFISRHPKSSDLTQKAAEALVAGLEQVPLVVNGVRLSGAPRPQQMAVFESGGKEIPFPPLGIDTIIIEVLAHP